MIPEPYIPPPLPEPGGCREPPPELWLNFLTKWEELAQHIPAVPDENDPDKHEIEEKIREAKSEVSHLIQRLASRASYGKVLRWVRAMGGLQWAIRAARPQFTRKEVADYADALVSPCSILAPDLADMYSHKYVKAWVNDDTL